ncbi:hypothetical protein GPECTOR_68g340 [Gonium pectorale]|uniref:Uncharacterized protein n=1 Tax=Gonium pectorale TaxID=33097 RepID=A0A150G3B3_GONPE|nr:hypothetical protein GPECTOR_68g340 [Gonium pectorale]|eukprot:KXZ44369.1 hypothetical protein GPECTOR_68g340 [Gonium pectorale]
MSAAAEATAPPAPVAGDASAAEGSTSFTSPITVTSVDESKYAEQLQSKLAKLRELFAEFSPPEVEVFESPPSHYRMRAEFTVDVREGELHYVMFDNSPEPEEQQQRAAGAAAAAEEGAGEPQPEPSTSSPSPPSGPAAAGKGAQPAAAAGKKRPRGPRRVRVESFPVASRQVMAACARVLALDVAAPSPA